MTTLRKIIMLVIMLTCLGACSSLETLFADLEAPTTSNESETTTALVGDVERGREIFRSGKDDAQRCANCHRVTTRGFGIDAGPNLEGIAEIAGTRIDGMSAEDYLRDSILNPLNFIVDVYRTPMPEDYVDLLSDQDVADLVAYMMQLTVE